MITNHADRLDYIVAVISGILTGLIDSFWVGEFSFDRGGAWGKEKVEKFVQYVAKRQGYKGDNLKGAIRYLEDEFPIPSDSNTNDFGGGTVHHLRDYAHHPTPAGLAFSMLTQFTGKAYGIQKDGSFGSIAIVKKELIGSDMLEKFTFGTIHWFFHMVSDMAGSSANPGAGAGLPSPLLSFAKKMSALRFFKNMEFRGDSLPILANSPSIPLLCHSVLFRRFRFIVPISNNMTLSLLYLVILKPYIVSVLFIVGLARDIL